MRKCPTCKRVLEEADFGGLSNRGNPHVKCIRCQEIAKAYQKARMQDPAYREMRKLKSAASYAKNGKAYHRAHQERYRAAHPDYVARGNERAVARIDRMKSTDEGIVALKQEQANNGFKKRYGITLQERDAMVEAQGHKCAVCERDERDLVAMKKGARVLHVDHCHKTGKVRAMLCFKCNLLVGVIENASKDALMRVAKYLELQSSSPSETLWATLS